MVFSCLKMQIQYLAGFQRRLGVNPQKRWRCSGWWCSRARWAWALLVSLLVEKGSSEGFRPPGYGCTSKGSQARAQLWLRAQRLPP